MLPAPLWELYEVGKGNLGCEQTVLALSSVLHSPCPRPAGINLLLLCRGEGLERACKKSPASLILQGQKACWKGRVGFPKEKNPDLSGVKVSEVMKKVMF